MSITQQITAKKTEWAFPKSIEFMQVFLVYVNHLKLDDCSGVRYIQYKILYSVDQLNKLWSSPLKGHGKAWAGYNPWTIRDLGWNKLDKQGFLINQHTQNYSVH